MEPRWWDVSSNKYLGRRAFRQFLEGRGDEPAGMTRDIHGCPIATYLEDATNREWHVSPLACVPQVDAEVEDHEFRPPRWARDLIHGIDRFFGKKPVVVTGNEVLFVLDEMVA